MGDSIIAKGTPDDGSPYIDPDAAYLIAYEDVGAGGRTLQAYWTNRALWIDPYAGRDVIFHCGVSDIFFPVTGLTLAQMQAEITQLVDYMHGLNMNILLGDLTPGGGFENWTAQKQADAMAYNDWLPGWAQARGIPVARIYRALVDPDDPSQIDVQYQFGGGDTIHPNLLGAQVASREFNAALAGGRRIPGQGWQ